MDRGRRMSTAHDSDTAPRASARGLVPTGRRTSSAPFDTGVAKRFLGNCSAPHRRAFLVAVVAVLVSAASVVAIPALIGRAVNSRGRRGDGALLNQTLIAFAGAGAAIYSTVFFLRAVAVGAAGPAGDLRHPPQDVRPLPGGVAVVHGQDPRRAGSCRGCRAT